LFHGSSVGGTLDVIDFKMCFASDKNTDSFSDSGFKLFIELINTDSVAEIENILFAWLASENNGNSKSNENIIVGWARSYLELVSYVLLCNQELDFGPWKAEVQSTFAVNAIEFSVLCDDGICSLRNINVWQT
jgi:hypothetical protein